MSPVCARRGLFSAEAIQAARAEDRKMKNKKCLVPSAWCLVPGSNGTSAGVINKGESYEQASRARVVCHTGLNNSLKAIPRVCAPARVNEAALAAWRVRTFGGDIDPVRAVVDDAVAAFSTRQPEIDRALWLKVANAIGWELFRELYFEELSIMADSKRRGHPLRNPAAAFHRRLQGFRPRGGAA